MLCQSESLQLREGLVLFSFFPNALSYLEITTLGSPRSIVKNCLCGEAEFCLSHGCILKPEIVVGNGLFVKMGAFAGHFLLPPLYVLCCFVFLGVGLEGAFLVL